MTLLAASIGAQLMDGLQNMIVGMGVVFVVLIVLSVVIWAFKFIGKLDKSQPEAQAEKKTPAPRVAAPAAAPAAPAGPGTMKNAGVSFDDEVEGPVAAVILAAVAENCGGDFTVKSIKKSK